MNNWEVYAPVLVALAVTAIAMEVADSRFWETFFAMLLLAEAATFFIAAITLTAFGG